MLASNARQFGVSLAGLAPLAWLMASMYVIAGPIGVLPFAVPLLATRTGYKKVVEIRDMFTQTVRSLAGAVDAKDPYTSGHSERVQKIAKDLGAELRCSEAELEALEWGGLLHDIGKIGIPDAVLLKQGALTREERMVMNAHPVKGEEIIKPVEKLAPELPIIRHHHEWFNGSGYPDRLVGHQIPLLARIMHVADSLRGNDGPASLPDDAADPGAGARRAAQVQRRAVRSGDRRRFRARDRAQARLARAEYAHRTLPSARSHAWGRTSDRSPLSFAGTSTNRPSYSLP